MEDWPFRGRAPLSTQVYPGRSHRSQQGQQGSPCTSGFH